MPVAYRLYLPESWVHDRKRRKKTGVPDSIEFQTKPDIALDQIRRARERGIPQGVVLADAGYGTDTNFRSELTKLEMVYVVGVQITTTVWKPGEEPKPAPTRKRQYWTPTKTTATRCQEPAGSGERACPIAAYRSMEESDLEARGEAEVAVTLCRHTGSSRASRLLALPTSSGRMAADGMASRGIRTNQVLAIYSVRRYRPFATGAFGQTSLDYRTGLSRTQTGTRVGPLRRTRMARLPSSRHVMHRGLWIPGGRTESFFPLGPYRQSWTSSARAAARLPAAWFAASVPSGIIRAPSLP